MKPGPRFEPTRYRAFPRQRRRRRGPVFVLGAVLAAAAVAVGLYAAAGFFGAPWLADRWLAQYGASGPDREISRQSLGFNPFTLAAEIEGLELRDRQAGTAVAVDRIVVDFAAASLLGRRPVASSLVIDRPRIDLASLDWLQAAGRNAQATWLERARIDRLDMTDGALTVRPGTGDGLEITRFGLSLSGYDGESGSGAGFSLDAATAAGAGITASGTVAGDLGRADGQLRLDAFELASAADRLLGATEPNGRFDLSADFVATSLLGEPRLELTDATVTASALSLTPTSGLTVTADTLEASGRLALAPADNGIDFGGRLEAGRASLVITDARATPPQSFTLEQTAVVATIEADSGSLSLILGGRLSGAGEAAVTVRAPAGSADGYRVSIEAWDLPATMLSAYAADALGREISAGSADLRIEYTFDGNRVDGSLHIETRELAFPQPADEGVPPGGAPSLELAAALLENAGGIIEIDLPFAGNTRRARDAAADALQARVAAVTETPFDTLAPLIGEGAAGAVPFLPGDAALTDRALATIGQLIDALNARPRLGIEVHAGFEPRVDRDALARQQIELHVELATAGPGGRRPTGIDVGSARVRDVLDEFAGERLRPERLAVLRDRYACEGELASACERAYYESIFDALVANEEISATTLSRLGRFRALSIVDALTGSGIAEERVELVMGGEIVDTPFGIGLPVELTVIQPGVERQPEADRQAVPEL